MPKMNIIVIGKYKNYVWLFSHKQGNYLETGWIITSLPQTPTREETLCILRFPQISNGRQMILLQDLIRIFLQKGTVGIYC